MAVVSLALFKKHVRADDFADDDELMQHYVDAAEAWVIQATNRTEDELQDESGNYPAQIKQAVLLLAAHWYNQRESVAGVEMRQVPDTLQALIKPFRKLAKDASGTDEV